MERKERGERSGKRDRKGSERERNEESMRDRDRWGSGWVRERGRLLKKRERDREGSERERKKPMCQNCMPTMNVNTLCIVPCS